MSEFIEIDQNFRKRIEATIEALIALLDQLDGSDDDEPSLGWSNSHPGCARALPGYDDEREDDPAERGLADGGAVEEFMGNVL